jgi:hypothetical protein
MVICVFTENTAGGISQSASAAAGNCISVNSTLGLHSVMSGKMFTNEGEINLVEYVYVFKIN